MKPPRVSIIWSDAHASFEEMTLEEAIRKFHKPVEYEIEGRLVKSDEVGVLVTHEQCKDEKDVWRGFAFVPRGMVVREERTDAPPRPQAPRKSAKKVQRRPGKKVS